MPQHSLSGFLMSGEDFKPVGAEKSGAFPWVARSGSQLIQMIEKQRPIRASDSMIAGQ
jgi:hypothetical protein